MSGILIPGQENKPQPSGGIEVAKGFSRKEEGNTAVSAETSQETPASEDTATSAEPPVPQTSRPSQPSQRGSDFRFPPRPMSVPCPGCNTPMTVAIFAVIDLGANPELKAPLLSGQINSAVCPQCGAGGALGAPLMVHSPEHEFLGVYVPPTGQAGGLQQNQIIGDLSETLMRKLSTEERRGYMLQPQPFMDLQRLMEKLWGFEGVTPEMLQRQSNQSMAMQQLLSIANDPSALDIAIERHKSLIDRDFFTMLQRALSSMQGQQGSEIFVTLYEKLLETTEVGAEIKVQQEKITTYLTRLGASPSQDELMDVMIEGWQDKVDGPEIVGTIGMVAGQMMDYQFLAALSERVEQAEDDEQKAELSALRNYIVSVQEQQRQATEAMIQRTQAMLQQVLESDKPMDTLREIVAHIDDTFLGVLNANIRSAEKNNASAAANRMKAIYQMAIQVVQENMPPEVRLLNQMISMEDADLRQYLKENHHQLTPEFIEGMSLMEEQMRQAGRVEVADRIKSVRGRVALMR